MAIGALTALDMLSVTHGSVTAAAKKSTPEAESAAATSFTAALDKAAGNTIGKMENAEQLSVAALQGGADMREVVDAVMDAEQTLKAAISIRDKIVQSYLEVSRMAI